MNISNKVLLTSPFYHYQGHFKDSADIFLKSKKINFDVAIISNREKNNFININIPFFKIGELGYFGLFGKYSIYLEQFFKIFINFFFLLKLKKKFKNYKNIFFFDYEYFSLIFFLYFFPNKNKRKLICIHSANYEKNIIYNIYKKIFFNFINKNNEITLVCNGKEIEKKIKKICTNKIYTIQFLVKDYQVFKTDKKTIRKKLGIDYHKKILLIFGILRKDKNYELALDIIKSLGENYVLIVAGNEGSIKKSELDDKIKNKGIKNVYVFSKYFSENEIAEFYSCADAYLFTYYADFDSQSGPVNIAAQFDLPIIIYNKKEVGKFVSQDKSNILISNYTIDSYCKGIKDFFNKKNHIKKNTNNKNFQEMENTILRIFS